MRARLLRLSAFAIAASAISTSALSQGVSFDNLDLASDLRFFPDHCLSIKTDWKGFEKYMRARGIPMDVFDRGSMDNAYIEARDREHEKDLKALGANAFCKRYYLRLYKTGLFRQLTPDELRDMNRIRMSNGGDEIKPLE